MGDMPSLRTHTPGRRDARAVAPIAWIRRAATIAFALIGLTSTANPVAGQDTPDILSVDQLLSIDSVISGTPHWSPDGERILITSSVGGGLVTLPPAGGFPTRVPITLGGAGHFLASQMPGWSPTGDWISYISNKSGAPEIWIWSTADGREVRLTNLGARINSMTWSPDERQIAFAGDRHGNYDVWTVSVPDGDVQRLTTDKRYEVFPTWTPDSQQILYVRLDDRWADHDVIAIDANGEDAHTVVRDVDFFDYGAGTRFGYPRVSPDGAMVLFPSHRSGWINYWTIPMDGGEPRRIAPADADQHDARWSPDGRSVVFTENHDGNYDLRIVPAAGGAPRVIAAHEWGRVSSPDWSPDGEHIAFTMATITRPADLFVVSTTDEDATPRPLTHSMPAGDFEARLIVPEKVRYASSDGYSIAAYLYRPPTARPDARVPGIVWVHGGPTGQYRDMLQPFGNGGSGDAQFFAQRGYAVLLPNIRGSSGYGKAFEDGNNGCWGVCDLEDVVAGAEYLKSLPYVNPDRMGITGTSYGGIMSMNAVTEAPDAFQAAIPASGYADWVHFSRGENELRHIKLLEYELGPLETSEELWRRASAIHGVANVSAPVFLVHGVGRYPGSDQSELFAQGLRNHYKPFKYTTYDDEPYYVLSPANRRQLFLDMLAFFDQYLKDGT